MAELELSTFDVSDGVVSGMETVNIIYRATTVGDILSWAYNIQPWAWKYLDAHPELLYSEEEDDT